MRQSDFGPFTAGNMGDAWLAAAAFERARLTQIISPTNTDGVSPQVRKLAQEACEADIMKYEQRAEVCFKFHFGDKLQEAAA